MGTTDRAGGGEGRPSGEEGPDLRELRESRGRLHSLVDNAPVGITEMDMSGRFIEVNPMACEQLQYTREELLGIHAADLVAPRFQATREDALARLVGGAERRVVYETAFVRPDGSEREAEVIATLVHDSDGRPVSILALVQDLTDRRRLETRALAQSALIDRAHDAILVTELDGGIITFWNPAAERLYGYSAAEAIGRNVHDLLRTEFAEALAVIDETVLQTGGWSGELLHLTAAGEAVWVNSRWVMVRDREGVPASMLQMNRDVSAERHLSDERRRLMEILETQNRELRESDRLKTEFLLTVSHELRTPLTAILGFADLLTLDSPLAERVELEIIQRNGRRLLSLIEDLLTVARVQAGDVQLRLQPIDLVTVARRVVEDHRMAAADKGLELLLRADGPVVSSADETAVSHVLRHLVSNAIKFTTDGHVAVGVESRDGRPRLTVEDTGIGVPEEARRLIFEEFRQVDQSITRAYGGLGIGLAVVRRLVVLQGGQLGVEDRPGGGSVFWVTLPATDEPAGEQPAGA